MPSRMNIGLDLAPNLSRQVVQHLLRKPIHQRILVAHRERERDAEA